MRGDIVDIALASAVAAASYVAPVAMRCTAPRTPLHQAGDAATVAVSELLHGEMFDVFDSVGDWAFGRGVVDRYIGWVAAAALGDPGEEPRLTITARAAPVFTAADIKAPVQLELPFGARVAGAPGERFFALAAGGFVHNRHLEPLPVDPVAVARRFLGAPYLWGGRTPAGVDCSGLVQAALAACGTIAPRDSDQQLATLGAPVAFADRRAGDLVFFPGHVGLLADPDTLLHANAFWMATVEEPLGAVIERLATGGVAEPVTGLRRL